MSEVQSFPLSSLTLSPLNVRQAKNPDSVGDLVASIAAIGPLQNLTVTVDKKGKKKPRVEVVAGGRRLLALQTLAKLGKLGKDDLIDCKVVTTEQAIEISIAENTQRKQMNPVEEVRAFHSLVDAGMPIEDVAARFGVTPLVVQRRLKLARVHPELLDLYATGDINLDQLTALAVTDDTDAQLACWNSASGWQLQPAQLRSRLLGDKPKASKNRLLKAVGVEAYAAAGGTFTTDLFEDRDNGYIDDIDLLQSLAQTKIAATIEAMKADGWAFADIDLASTHYWDAAQGYGRLQAQRRDFTDAEQARINVLETSLAEIQDELEALGDEDEEDSERATALDEKFDALNSEKDALEEAATLFTEAQMQVGGLVGYIDGDGKVQVLPGVLREGTRDPCKTLCSAGSETDRSSGTTFHTPRLTEILTAQRTLALQSRVMADPSLALLAVLEPLVERLLSTSLYFAGGSRCRISPTGCTSQLLGLLPDETNTPAAADVRAATEQWLERYRIFANIKLDDGGDDIEDDDIEDDAGDENEGDGQDRSAMAWLLTLNADERMGLLAVLVGMTLDQRRMSDHTASGDAFTRYAGLDMHDYWKPTAAGYFAFLKKSQILDVLKSNGIKAEGVDKLKKSELCAKAEALMQEHAPGWLPGPLQA